jgi:hypothetical protein
MKKLHVLTAAAGILLALAGPSLAASRQRGVDANANTYTDRSGAYYFGPQGAGYNSYARANSESQYVAPQFSAPQYGYGPYPDRAYGDPDRD